MNWLQIITYAGTFIFAVTGALKARTHLMDIFGGAVLAFVTAYGGGTLRDILLGVKPVNWVNDNIALGLVISALISVFLFKENLKRFNRIIFFTDAIGLGLFTASGIKISLQNGISPTYAIIMGVISSTFGGLLADILCNEIPALLRKGELYATASLIGGIVFISLKHNGINDSTNLLVCVVLVVSIRILAKRKKLYLPEI
ncbi:trimeric intracellular cation channel family protein [Cytophagaceae bacterium DM2B3-1]|uniref:Trimeric intracellular cation channel family protein n=1 Tax=Xanthocytophaga flava TaxID=3048013 RepID=A0ABT7CJU3_9BACT|nr:trimeric intracellular cation channel family protein [Xanthocytophaga flavus]MDJ1469499.1 trimeric intracellular cation channel family protein [Xanthocytophaga flavus]MDJ1493988.1 trimeric intracellular cation channel family protein [Xanthocytophaga flavus]